MDVVAVIVAYHPKEHQVERLTAALRRNGARVVVVDNTDGKAPVAFGGREVTWVGLGDNTGIAHALNVGIERALSSGADIVVLFDQDSVVDDGFIAALVAPLRQGEPGITAPLAMDRKGNEYPSQRVSRHGYPSNVFVAGGSSPVAVDLVITSGCAATAATFSVAGVMDEDLFIDYVDFEWCFRCRKENVPMWVVPQAVLDHEIGQSTTKVGPLRTFIHSPARTYYKVRNSFLLLRKRHIPLLYSLRQLAPTFVHCLIQLGIVPEKSLYFRTFCVATGHGIRGVRGKRPP